MAAHRHAPNLRLVEVDVDTAAYDAGHVPGAVGWDWHLDLRRCPVRDIPDEAEWEALLGRSGIGTGTTVDLSGDHHNWFTAFDSWLFTLYGRERVTRMNGGRQKWVDEGCELTLGLADGLGHDRDLPGAGGQPHAARRAPIGTTWLGGSAGRGRR